MTHALPAAVEQTGATSLGDRGASYLRTVVPVIWGSVITQLLAVLAPHLPGDVGATLSDWLSGEAAIALVTAVVIAGWYALWRIVEPRLPDWLTRILLGSAATPTYAKVVDGVAVVTALDGTRHVGVLPVTATDDDPDPVTDLVEDEFTIGR